MTHAEVILWNFIRRKQIHNIRFRRQFSIGNFIIDFYAPELLLAIEIDGPTHFSDDEIKYDRFRQEDLEKKGIKFLRFTNDDIYENIESVVSGISQFVEVMLNSKKTPS